MTTYSDLTIENFYLVQENENEEVVLIQPLMQTHNCVFIMHHDDEETTYWRRKTDEIFEIIDELTEEQAEEYQNLFEDETDGLGNTRWEDLN